MNRTDICKLCYEVFGNELRPRVLHCGHSYCTDCLDNMFDNGKLSCPKCKKTHEVSSARAFSINYDLEEILLEARNAKSSVTPASLSSIKVFKMQMLIAEQKPRINNLILSAEDMKSQLKGYDDFLINRKSKHDAVLQKIRELGSLHEALVEEIQEERQRIMDVQNKGDGYCKKVKDKLPNLDTTASNKAAADALAEALECLSELEEWIDQCQQEFPFPKITVAEQILSKSLDVLSLMDSKTDEKFLAASFLSYKHLTIMEKLDKIDENTFTLDNLRVNRQRWTKRIEEGQVYAIDSSNGRKRSAKLSEDFGIIYLPYLQDKEAPLLAHTIEHSEVVKSLNKDSTEVFLDLAWDGSFKGRVQILLSPDTPLARQFRILCTGQLGPSYAHSKFIQEEDYEYVDCILGGDYEYNNGEGGTPVMEGLDRTDSIYYRKFEQGSVLVPLDAIENKMAQFVIVTGETDEDTYNFQKEGIFGNVQFGTEILKKAVRSGNISQVEIINCGVQLPV